MHRLCLCVGFLFTPTPIQHAYGQSEVRNLTDVHTFLKEHCYRCHGKDRQENRKRFDNLAAELDSRESLTAWQGILDQLNLGEMPPGDEPQPDSDQTSAVIQVLTKELREGWAQYRSVGGRTVARRLNRFELRNTVRDLLYLQDPTLRVGSVARLIDNNGNGRVENTSTDPFRSFPADEVKGGFDNIGDRLVMSDFLLKLMLDAAEESLTMATHLGPEPKRELQTIEGHVQKQVNGDLERLAREKYPNEDRYYRRIPITPDPLRGGVRTSGRYRVTFDVSAYHQAHPWNEMIPTNGKPFILSLRLWKTRTRDEFIPLRTFTVPGNGRKHSLSFDTYIHSDWTPQLFWENGPQDREARTEQLARRYLPNSFQNPPTRMEFPEKKEYDEQRRAWASRLTELILANYAGPWLKVHRVTLEPLDSEWPPRSHRELYGSSTLDEQQIEARLTSFARRAWRRPVQTSEIEPYVALVQQQLTPPAPETRGPIEDLTWKFYVGKWTKLPKFDDLEPDSSGLLPDGLIDMRVSQRPDYFGLVFESTLHVSETGDTKFRIASDDGSRVLIDGRQIIDHDGLHGASIKGGSIRLDKGPHKLRVEYFAYGNPNNLRLWWTPPKGQESLLSVDQSAKPAVSAQDLERVRQVEALKVGYTAILCSPDFLYLKESDKALSDFQLASRLSYFLWSSMPDDELFELAESGTLRQPSVLRAQTERMLSSSKAAAFTRHFTERWLRLDKLAESPPELNGPFRVYWDRRLEPQIVAQADLFFADLVQRNGQIRDVITSDYTFLNEHIASVFYNRKDVRGDMLQRVEVVDERRGGMLTMPAAMTATANGVDTSPIVRGIWVLENILGTPPPPPPPDVEPLSPDLRNAKTIREQLQVHRAQPACNGCHQKIDPLGFAFENFDPIGRWRTHYPKNGPVDPSTTLNGKEVPDIRALKDLLKARERDVARCLANKLLSYSTGRLMEPDDRGAVEAVVGKAEGNGYRLRDIIHAVVQSPAFQTK